MKLGRGLTLLLGGARSGKSDLAVKLGEAWTGSVTFLATATAGDDDMATRIERHQAERPAFWSLVEQPHLSAADVDSVDPESLVIIDCLTLLTANLMFADKPEPEIVTHTAELAASLANRSGPALVISNEVGLGVHPDTPLGREYRDILGRVNRAVAAAAETSLFVVAGKVMPLTDLDMTW